MCAHQVDPTAVSSLADLLREICSALCPEDPESVIVGPVDFGSRL